MFLFVPSQNIPLLLILLIFSLTTNNTTSSLTINSTHEIFNVKQAITPLETHEKIHVADENVQENGTLKLELIHRDKLQIFSRFSTYNKSNIFEDRMDRDSKRVSSIMQRITNGVGYQVDGFGSDVVSGMDQGSGEYFVRIGVGSPPKDQYMVLDSGSDIVWVQCQPCTQCYHQSDPVFDPSLSVSFTGVPCRTPVCDRVENSGCHAGRCKYEVMYGDGSYTKGTMAIETLTFGHVTVKNVAIGCGHSNSGMFTAAAGLLGLGGGSMSLVGQLGGQTGGAFSYCLVSRGTGSTGSLEFGRGVLPMGAAWVPLIRNPLTPSFYYIGLLGLGVGGVQVPISEDVFKITELGDGGVVMDTGTAVTRLPSVAYVAFRDAFLVETASLPRAPAVSIFDTCYDLDGFVTVRVPTVSFFLSGGQILTLPARNFLIPVNDKGTFCFAFAPSPTGLSIIGNIQQEGIQISFDGANGFVGFGPNIC
ncbi:Protein ASPARTIC PROTEASE IN GUARD CELL 2 [Capsicum annuum]|uniref:protein ASPARTIC PROTEASE IN GUARD CELL 2 n=1 Tax=Capsicum annuum TaxID=4072 RepID=UPI0007BF7A76|nr:protein ASPARTIC PROTEASE IN GUARD CELL 2 [Capsicum annuum]KAF3618823.1 Protein ASPARTIC PROTEASE IN GUARD CELL 2 [Capsicum annuum]KAF3646173.1 Protein ASPARTIC PROTEASE IN GUARD CELL 2 [Capsicum annuum]